MDMAANDALVTDTAAEPPRKTRGPRKGLEGRLATYRLFVDMCQDLKVSVTKSVNLNVAVTHFVLDQGGRAPARGSTQAVCLTVCLKFV